MEQNNICQSCSMPMRSEGDNGTNTDGSINREYCRHCMKEGKFTDEGITMEQKIDKMVELAGQMHIAKDKAREMAKNILPRLKRWQKQ